MNERKLVKENIGIEDVINEYGSIVWNCKGQSMKPLIREKVDYVVIEKPNGEISPFEGEAFLHSQMKESPGFSSAF